MGTAPFCGPGPGRPPVRSAPVEELAGVVDRVAAETNFSGVVRVDRHVAFDEGEDFASAVGTEEPRRSVV